SAQSYTGPKRRGKDAPPRGLEARAPCADETMNPTSENLSPSETRSRGEAKGYCVGWAEGSIRGGEHPEATDWSQTQVNSIRPVQRAELAEKSHLPEKAPGGVGEAWAASP